MYYASMLHGRGCCCQVGNVDAASSTGKASYTVPMPALWSSQQAQRLAILTHVMTESNDME